MNYFKYVYIFLFNFVLTQEIISINPTYGNAGDQNLTVELIADDINFYDAYTSVNNISFNSDDIDISNYYVTSSNTLEMTINISNTTDNNSVYDVSFSGFDGYSWEYFNDTMYDAFTVFNLTPVIDVDIQYITEDFFSETSYQNYQDNGATTSHIFTVSEFATSYPLVDVEIYGDFDSQPEHADIFYEDMLIGTLADFYDPYGEQNHSGQYTININSFNSMLDDGVGNDFNEDIEIRVANTTAVDEIGGNFHQVEFSYNKLPGFGKVLIGETVAIPISISNFGGAELNVYDIQVSNNQFYLSENSFTVGVEETKYIDLFYSPNGYGYTMLDLNIFSDDPNSPFLFYQISGYGIESDYLSGDVNGDGGLSILDVIILVNLLFDGQYTIVADLNQDGILNIADCVILVNLILNQL